MGTGDGRTGVPRIWLATTAVAPVSPCTSGRRVGYGVVAERAGLNCINYVCVCVCVPSGGAGSSGAGAVEYNRIQTAPTRARRGTGPGPRGDAFLLLSISSGPALLLLELPPLLSLLMLLSCGTVSNKSYMPSSFALK